jgi:hypothetical protein
MFNRYTIVVGLLLNQLLFSCTQKDCLNVERNLTDIESLDSVKLNIPSINPEDITVISYYDFKCLKNSNGKSLILDSTLQVKDSLVLKNGIEIYSNQKHKWKGNLDFGEIIRENIITKVLDTFKINLNNDSFIVFNNYLFPPIESNGILYGFAVKKGVGKISSALQLGKFKINERLKLLTEFSTQTIDFKWNTKGNYYTFPVLTETPQGLWLSTSVGAQAFSIQEKKLYDFSSDCLPQTDSFALTDINDFNIIRKHSLMNPNYKFIGTISNDMYFLYQEALPYSDSLFKVTPKQKLLKINKDTKQTEGFTLPKNILTKSIILKDNELKYLTYAKDNSLYWHTIKF